MTLTAYDPRSYDIYIGIDVDKKSFSFTVTDHNQMNICKTIPANAENLSRYIQNTYAGKRVVCAYEAGCTGYHLHDQLQAQNISCFIVPPAGVPKASTDRVKNNRLDSEKIARLLTTAHVPSIHIPPEAYRELRLLVTSREQYARQSISIKQKIKSLVLFSQLHLQLRSDEQRWSGKYIAALKKLACSPGTQLRLSLLLEDLEYTRNQYVRVVKALRMQMFAQPELQELVKLLMTIPGIGFVIAVTVIARIGNPAEIRNVRQLAAFVGLVPTEYSTGDTVSRGHITHHGNRMLRALLIQAAWIMIRKDARMQQFFNRIRSRNHKTAGSLKAIVAVARKLTMIIFAVLKEQRPYRAY